MPDSLEVQTIGRLQAAEAEIRRAEQLIEKAQLYIAEARKRIWKIRDDAKRAGAVKEAVEDALGPKSGLLPL